MYVLLLTDIIIAPVSIRRLSFSKGWGYECGCIRYVHVHCMCLWPTCKSIISCVSTYKYCKERERASERATHACTHVHTFRCEEEAHIDNERIFKGIIYACFTLLGIISTCFKLLKHKF